MILPKLNLCMGICASITNTVYCYTLPARVVMMRIRARKVYFAKPRHMLELRVDALGLAQPLALLNS